MSMKHLFCFLLMTFSISVIYQLSKSPNADQVEPDKNRAGQESKSSSHTKHILYWTTMWGQKDFWLGTGGEIFKNCPKSNCFATYDRSLMPVEDFSAVMFHGVEYIVSRHGKPNRRSPEQVYIYANLEPPKNTPRLPQLVDFFNWTMTYRSDSDVIRTYGIVVKKETDYTPPTVDEIRKKPGKIAWMVSNCEAASLRGKLQEKISQYMTVDVYGDCGTLKCTKKDDNCYDMLEKGYKFYLSFENSFCEDYVTEKMFYILKRNLIPIVYGGADYEKIAPPNSVIDVTKFDTVTDLAAHLYYLDEQPEEYLKYFEWKKSFVVDTSHHDAVCNLCEKLNEPIENNRKVYSKARDWWDSQGVCKYGDKLPKIVFS